LQTAVVPSGLERLGSDEARYEPIAGWRAAGLVTLVEPHLAAALELTTELLRSDP
jgi:hypothetical protein